MSLEDVFQEIVDEIEGAPKVCLNNASAYIIEAPLPVEGLYGATLLYSLSKDGNGGYNEELTVIMDHENGKGKERMGEIRFLHDIPDGIIVDVEIFDRQVEGSCRKEDIKWIIYRALNMKPNQSQIFH